MNMSSFANPFGSFARRSARQLAVAGLLIVLGCGLSSEASAQLDTILQTLLRGATAPPQPYRPAYPPSYPPSYPGYTAQPTSPGYPGYPASPPANYQPPAPSPRPAQTAPDRASLAELQRMLNDLGYAAGPADGTAGPQTIAALRSFERDHGQALSGEISAVTLAAVRSVWYEHHRAAVEPPSSAAQASGRASFDCARATTPAERAICESPALAQLDGETAASYAAAFAGLSAQDQSKLTAEERAWLQQRNRCGADSGCLAQSMTARLALLRLLSARAPGAPIGSSQQSTSAQLPAEPVTGGNTQSDIASTMARLAQPQAGLRSIKLPMREGLPVFALDPYSSGYEALFFRLVALRIKPGLIESDDDVDNARQLANDFLTRPNKYLGQNSGWAGTTEFDREASRHAFLTDYRKTFEQMGPKLPFQFIYAAGVRLGPYDAKLGGFPLIGAPDLRNLPFGWLRPFADFKWPDPFLPIDEAGARKLLDRLAAARDTTRGDPRAVRLAAIMEASAKAGSLELRLTLRRLTVYDNKLGQSLYEFPISSSSSPPAQNIVSRLLTPPPGVMPIRLRTLNGRPILDQDEPTRRLLALITLGSIPNLLRERQGVVERSIDGLETLLVMNFLTPEIQSQLLFNPNVQLGNNWIGDDEFDRQRTRHRFEHDYLPKLKELAPHAPFEFAYAYKIGLPEYDAKRGGYGLGKLGAPEDLLANGIIWLPPSLRWAPQFDQRDLFWPLDATNAQRMLHQFEQAAARRNDPGSYRVVQLVSILEVSRVDPDTGRADLRLKSIAVYTSDLQTKLYAFPPIAAEPEPYSTAGLPAKLEVPSPAPLDAVFLDLKLIEAAGDKTPAAPYAALWSLIEERDQTFYSRPNPWAGLAPNDARRPFFPRGIVERSPATVAAFQKWADLYAAGLPRTATVSATGMSGERQDGSRLVQPLERGNVASAESYAKFLRENRLQADQLVSAGTPINLGGNTIPVVFVVPNRWSLYTLTIPKQAFVRHPGATPTSVSTFRLGKARLIRNEHGQNVLALDLAPLSTKSSIGDDILASRKYDDIPRLDGQGVGAPSAEAAAPAQGSAFALNSTVLDLLAAKAVGTRLSPQALSYLIERRWLSENKGIAPGGRYFTLGKQQPTPEEAAALAPDFLAWARDHAPSLPVRVTITGRVAVPNGQQTMPWRAVPCLAVANSAGSFSPGSEVSSLSRQKAMAVQGAPTWSRQDEEKLAVLDAVSGAAAFYVGGPPTGPCGLASPRIPFQDPASFTIRIPHALPTPNVAALAGKQQLDLTAALDIISVALSDRQPSLADLLPADLRKILPPQTQGSPAGEFVSFDTAFVEARWSDPQGGQVARLGPDHGDDLDGLIKRFQETRAKLVAAAATPSGPYGPDLVGVRLGMSFADAERAIRDHMKVGRVLTGRRAFDAAEKSGALIPLDSGKLFISADEDELIAILDEPPAAKERVLAVWRRVSLPAGKVAPAEIFAEIEKKYGPPGNKRPQGAGAISSWYQLTGSACAGVYLSGHGNAFGETWFEDGRPMAPPANSVQAKTAMLPDPLFHPTDERSQLWSRCGPFVTAYLLTGQMTRSPRDELDMTLSDIGPYLKAYAESSTTLQGAPAGASPKDARAKPGTAAAIKF